MSAFKAYIVVLWRCKCNEVIAIDRQFHCGLNGDGLYGLSSIPHVAMNWTSQPQSLPSLSSHTTGQWLDKTRAHSGYTDILFRLLWLHSISELANRMSTTSSHLIKYHITFTHITPIRLGAQWGCSIMNISATLLLKAPLLRMQS